MKQGDIFGRLTLGAITTQRRGGELLYDCTCSCGGSTQATRRELRKGQKKSCGCLYREFHLKGAANLRYKPRNPTRRRDRTPEHLIWRKMHARCKNPTDHKFMYYGARGIGVDARWNTFDQFLADMGPRPSNKHSIDRINGDGPYSPENCRWATTATQQANRRSVRHWIVRGHKLTVTDIAAVLNRNPDQVHDYLTQCVAKGMTVEQALAPMVVP